MKIIKTLLWVLLIVLAGCTKPSTTPSTPIVPIPPVIPPVVTHTDSAKLILVSTKLYNGSGYTSYLSAYDLSRNLKWERSDLSFLTTFFVKPGYSGDALTAGTFNNITSLNPVTGTSNWSYSIPGTYFSNAHFSTDTVLMANESNNSINLLSKTNGTLIWTKTVTDQPFLTPVTSGNTIFCPTVNSTATASYLKAYDLTTKNLLWQTPISNLYLTTNILIKQDSIYFGIGSAQLFCISITTGSIYWSKTDANGKFYYYNGGIFLVDGSFGYIAAINIRTGATLWQTNVPLLNNIDLIYFYNGNVYCQPIPQITCVSTTTGAIQWSKNIGYNNFQKLTVVGNSLFAYNGKLQLGPYNIPQSRIMIMNASDFTAKDSIILQERDYLDMSATSVDGLIY